MAQSREDEIEYLRSLTGWTDRQQIIELLEICEWNLMFAVEVYLTSPDGSINDQSTQPILRRMKSRETELSPSLPYEWPVEQLTQNNNHTNHHQQASNNSSMNSSLEPTTTHSGYNLNASNITSFIEHANQLVVNLSDANTASPLFSDIHRFANNKQQLIRYIDSNVIGKDRPIDTPWGIRKLVYADYTASGRGLTFIVHYMQNYVLPFYANTHSEHNACASQTTAFREGSRKIIKKCVNATDDDAMIFVGSGSTAAGNKLVRVLNLTHEQVRSNTVVFISTFEHHSNILPWRETGVEIVTIPNNPQGLLDQDNLRQQLNHYHHDLQHIICTFSAASNVTGIRTDVDSISTLVHEYNGWIFWDYAAAAPYVKIDMNPSATAYKDAVFISTHKFVGGPSTPGLLIAKRKLFTNSVPSDSGGGTVNYVIRTRTEYVKDIEAREEGGTQDILGSIQAGLVFHLKEAVSPQFIEACEDKLVDKFFNRFRNHKTLLVLGSSTAPRLAIFSFLIYVESMNKYLHHNFVCVLLNDLFGIQVRSGCSCAGPYVVDLLHINDETANIYARFITENESERLTSSSNNALMKPGFIRFNLSYFASDEEVAYILDAVEFIANHGWKFLPLYTYNSETAGWHLRDRQLTSNLSASFSLQRITFEDGTMQENARTHQQQLVNSSASRSILTSSSDDPLEQAISMAENIPKYVYDNVDFRTDPPLNIPDEYRDFIWFVTPKEIIRKMVNEFEQNEQCNRIPVPFHPRS